MEDARKSAMKNGEIIRELDWLRRCGERSAAKIMELSSSAIAIRHELEQKRRGFRLLADLDVTLRRDSDYEQIFVSVSRRINAALNMQRTVVLVPEPDGTFKPFVLQGYPPDAAERVGARRIRAPLEFLDPASPVLVTAADAPARLAKYAAIREALELPFFISSPAVVNNRIAALLITGRVVEQVPFLTRLGPGDVETVQTVAAHLAAVLAEQQLAEAEERTKIMLDATPLCCNFWDANYRNIDCNQEAVRLFGLANKQEYLDRFHDLSPECQPNGRRSDELSVAIIQKAFDNGYARFEWMHQKLSGEPIPTEITLVRVKRGDSYIVAGYTRDLREQKAMIAAMRKKEDELRLARDIAEKNARAKSEFLANMSHEIRTPMNAVLGMIHILGNSELTEKQRDYLEKAEHSAGLLMRIINDILDFSKIDAGKLEMERTRFSLRTLVGNIRDIIGTPAEQKGLALSLDVAEGVPDLLLGDPLRLEQVLLNIASNAVKFTQEGGVGVCVTQKSVSHENRIELLFEVADTGIGLSQEQLEGLFSPFSQADTSMTRKYGGTGLGLAISRSLVELMGGSIWCESTLGKGSRFFFTVNLELACDESAGGAEPEGAPGKARKASKADRRRRASGDGDDFGDLAGMRVLLAEDNEINQLIAIELLSAKGVEVTATNNGREALEALAKNEYDLVLMDIQMPEMDGLSATAKIRENPKYADLPIVAMTAHAMAGDREISLSGGMNDHITKPIDPKVLYETLRRWDGCD